MAETASVTFFYHSGLMIAVEKTLLIFDYWEGDQDGSLPLDSRLTERDMQGFEQVIFLVSHDHKDHMDPKIYAYNFNSLPITYVLSSDIPPQNRGLRISEGETIRVGTALITAYGSTDKGVSFYVSVGGMNIFHAGDLNFWHWRDEFSLSEIRRAENAFYRALEPLEQLPMDIAMFPVDPRQGGMYDAGANHFIMTVKPRVFIPIHWRDKPEVSVDYARRGRTRYTDVVSLTRPREQAVLTFDNTRLGIHIIAPVQRFAPSGTRKKDVELEHLSGSDPFSETDLPVSLKYK